MRLQKTLTDVGIDWQRILFDIEINKVDLIAFKDNTKYKVSQYIQESIILKQNRSKTLALKVLNFL